MLLTVWECVFWNTSVYYKCILQHDEEPTAQVMNLAHLLETCQFREFWVNKILLLLFFSLWQSHCFVILLWMKYFFDFTFICNYFSELVDSWHVHLYFHFFPVDLIQGALRTNPDLTANIRGFDDSIRKCKHDIPAYQFIKLVMYSTCMFAKFPLIVIIQF